MSGATATANPLVAPRVDTTETWTGVVIAEDVEGLVHGIKSGSWIEAGLGIVGTGMDALAFVVDPFGSLAAWGVGWLIEHVGPLREALDKLAGDPAQITAFAATWANVSRATAAGAADLRARLADLESWRGRAGDAYRDYAGSHIDTLLLVSKATDGLASGVSAAGLLVASVRTIVRDLIAQFVGRIAVWAAEVILSFGVGLLWVAEQVAVAVQAWAVRLATFLRKLTISLRRLTELLTRLKAIIAQLSQRLRRPAPALPREPGWIPPERQLPPPSVGSRDAARKAIRDERLRLAAIREGIERTDRALAAGTHPRRFSQADLDWLNADPRHKEIAYDPGPKTYRVSEARQALAAEKLGVIPGPVKRAIGSGEDILDGDGVPWSFKGTGPRPDVEYTVDLAVAEARNGARTVLDLRLMSMREQAAVRTMIVERLAGTSHPEIRFVPPGVERIAPR
jgi:hypothetical protein